MHSLSRRSFGSAPRTFPQAQPWINVTGYSPVTPAGRYDPRYAVDSHTMRDITPSGSIVAYGAHGASLTARRGVWLALGAVALAGGGWLLYRAATR